MSARLEILDALPLAASATVAKAIESLGLEAVSDRERPTVQILRQRGGAPVAALVPQDSSLRKDKAAIESLKVVYPSMPIIFLPASGNARRETAIRRMGIHYFLAHPVEADELHLVLDVLLRASSPLNSFERFFSR